MLWRLVNSLLLEGNQTMSDAFLTCDLCDAYRDDASKDLRVLPPVFRTFGGKTRFSGVVLTVRCFEDNALVKTALEQPGEGRVLVIDGGASMRRALVGGNIGAAAARNNWAGVLVNGCVRDVAELAVLPMGILALASMPLPPRKLGDGENQVPVMVQGLWIHPGEWLAADEDGVIVLPTQPR